MKWNKWLFNVWLSGLWQPQLGKCTFMICISDYWIESTLREPYVTNIILMRLAPSSAVHPSFHLSIHPSVWPLIYPSSLSLSLSQPIDTWCQDEVSDDFRVIKRYDRLTQCHQQLLLEMDGPQTPWLVFHWSRSLSHTHPHTYTHTHTHTLAQWGSRISCHRNGFFPCRPHRADSYLYWFRWGDELNGMKWDQSWK